MNNTASYRTTIVAFGLFKPLLTGYRQIFALLLLSVCYTMGMCGVGIFAAVGLNSTAGDWAIYAGIAGSVLGSIFLVWLLEQLLEGARCYRKLAGDAG